MGILGWIVIGGLAGWVASRIMDADEQQGLLNIAVGVIGGLLGGWLLAVLGVDTDSSALILTFVTALIGACLLLFAVRAVTRRA